MKFICIFFSLSLLIAHPAAYAIQIDTLGKDLSLSAPSKEQNNSINSMVQSEVRYSAMDSIKISKNQSIIYLYGQCRVIYTDFELDADFITIDQKNHSIFASGTIDPKTKHYKDRVILKQKTEQPVIADSLRFDYNTKKGKLFQAHLNQDGYYLSSGQSKIFGKEGVSYKNLIISSCDLPYPDTHFGIVATKGMADNRQIIVGISYVLLENVPLPLAIPFGFFPKPNRRASGILFPSYGEDHRGLFLNNLGYYIGFNDYWHAINYVSIYSKGSFELKNSTEYKKRYKYGGAIHLSYALTKNDYDHFEDDRSVKDFRIEWYHKQDPKARPGTTFSAHVDLRTSSYYANVPNSANYYDIVQLSNNNIGSNITYAKTWQWGRFPFNYTMEMRHRQVISTKTVTLTAPQFTFNMPSISPFNVPTGKQKWHHGLTISYSLAGSNRLSNVHESQLLMVNTLKEKLQNSLYHQSFIGFPTTLLKYMQLNPSINYNEYWYVKTIRKRLEKTSYNKDTIRTITIPGFSRMATYALGTSFSTNVFGLLHFKNSRLSVIRHRMMPSISLDYHPNFSTPRFGKRQIPTSTQHGSPMHHYSIYEDSPYQPSTEATRASMSFSISNDVEVKIKPKNTLETDRKIRILQNFNITTTYDFAADSFKLSNINFGGRIPIFNQLGSSIVFKGAFNPYVKKEMPPLPMQTRTRTMNRDRYTWQDGSLPWLEYFNIRFNLSYSLNANSPKSSKDAEDISHKQEKNNARNAMTDFTDFNIPWRIALAYSLSHEKHFFTGRSSIQYHSVNIEGSFMVTPKWALKTKTGYDFKAKKMTNLVLQIVRDLHCWELLFRWIPLGWYKSYSVKLEVKAFALKNFLKWSKNGIAQNAPTY